MVEYQINKKYISKNNICIKLTFFTVKLKKFVVFKTWDCRLISIRATPVLALATSFLMLLPLL
tara:strand:+ start:3085 stop:3273 length:189 start_codon:yes stop_codon:yes gene_type:complete